jgi:hypothetical protein
MVSGCSPPWKKEPIFFSANLDYFRNDNVLGDRKDICLSAYGGIEDFLL